jgi:hypothetical protein
MAPVVRILLTSYARRRSRSVSLSITALPGQATSHPASPGGCFQKPGKGARHKSFGLCRRGWRVWQKTGMRTCSHTPLCGVARGCAGLSVVDGLSGDTWSLRRGWEGSRHDTGRACARRADSAWPVIHTTLPCGPSHFIFDSISAPRVG